MPRMQVMRLISIFGAFLAGAWLPLRMIGFIPSLQVEILFDLAISLISAINIYLYAKENDLNLRQLKSWQHWAVALDLMCFVPFSLFAMFHDTGSSFYWLLLVNLLSVRHVKNIRKFMDGYPSIHPVIFRIVPLLVSMPLLVHIVSCGWIALGSGTIGNDSDPILTYVRAIYWSFTTLTTVGYGDISAKTIAQMLYACCIQVIGVGVFGYILSNVAAILARSEAARNHHMDNLDKIETFMNMHRIPNELRGKIRTFYHYMWMNKKGYQDDSLLSGLPAKIQSELLLHINSSIIEKVPFLKGADTEMLAELMNQLQTKVFIPDEKIFKFGDPGEALYFIQSGEVEILTREGQSIATLKDGAFFGEMALISDRPRMATAQSRSYCDIYILEKASFEKVISSYPEFRKHIHETMEKRKSA